MLSLAPAPARAYWTSPSEVILGTAQTLEQGELLIGVLSPAVYGVTDTVMVALHPINWALLTPNAALTVRAYDSDWSRLSFTAEGAWTPDSDVGRPIVRDQNRPLAHLTVYGTSTFEVGGGVLLTARAGYQRDFEPGDNDFVWNAGLNWLISDADMLMVQGGFQYSFGRKTIKTEQVTLTYVRAWEVFHLAVGLAWGNFPIALIDRQTNEVELKNVPLWPVFDAFWRF